MATAELLEIGVSHYCEKARWALDFHGIPYVRRSHMPIISRIVGRFRGVWHSVPVLFTKKGAIPESTAILTWAESQSKNKKELIPSAYRDEIMAWIELFDQKLGPATRRIVYYYALPRAQLANPLLQDGIPVWEKLVTRPLLPVMRKIIQKRLKIDHEGAERSRQALKRVWDKVDEALGDGRSYLVAGRFTAADLCFASLAAPVLLPKEYGTKMPSMEQLPPEAQEEIKKLQATRVGQYALRIYREHRTLSK